MSNEMISVPRDLAVELLDGLRITQERARKELRALLAKPAEPKGEPDPIIEVLKSNLADGVMPSFSGGDLKHLIRLLEAAPGATAQPQGETVDALLLDDCVEHKHPGYGGGYFGTEVVKLYTSPAEQHAQKYDDTLLPFMELMRRELHANSHKGDRPEWLKMTASTALEEIAHHFNKLDEAVGARDNPQIREYAADIANICMMLLDICGELAFVRQPEPVSSTSDKYKAELYDEVWQLARDMGFGNVTDALMKLKKQTAPVAVVLPEPFCRQKLSAEGKPYPRSNCAVCGPFSPKWRECDAMIEAARLNPPQQ